MATTVGVSDLAGFSTAEKVSPAPQQPRLIGYARRPEYMFVHTVRFWSMLAIVFMHSALAPISSRPRLVPLVQPFKFGTIGFFLISGFLLGDRLPASRPLGYLRRRANRLIPPWLFWLGLEVLYMTYRNFAPGRGSNLSIHLVLLTALRNVRVCLNDTALWFVPNLLVGMICLVFCRKWLNDLRLGALFLAANLFYSVNVYTCWIPSTHTEAIFGFVFYLWLGAWCSLRKEQLEQWARSLGSSRLLTCIALALLGSLLETHVISRHHIPNALNTLRFCNQVYSLLMVIFLLRIRRVTWPGFVNVAATTHGIYLMHSIVLALIFGAAAPFVFRWEYLNSYAGLICVGAVLAPVVYGISLVLTNIFRRSPWPWIVGAVKNEAPATDAPLVRGLQSASSPN